MIQTKPPQTPIVHRLDEISPLGVAKFTALLGLLGSIACAVWLVRDFVDPSFSKGLAIVVTVLGAGTLGSFLGGLILAVLYNVLSRYTGGLKLYLSPVDPSEALGPDAIGQKQCPQCQAQVRADRSFCPQCDHSFPKET